MVVNVNRQRYTDEKKANLLMMRQLLQLVRIHLLKPLANVSSTGGHQSRHHNTSNILSAQTKLIIDNPFNAPTHSAQNLKSKTSKKLFLKSSVHRQKTHGYSKFESVRARTCYMRRWIQRTEAWSTGAPHPTCKLPFNNSLITLSRLWRNAERIGSVLPARCRIMYYCSIYLVLGTWWYVASRILNANW